MPLAPLARARCLTLIFDGFRMQCRPPIEVRSSQVSRFPLTNVQVGIAGRPKANGKRAALRFGHPIDLLLRNRP